MLEKRFKNFKLLYISKFKKKFLIERIFFRENQKMKLRQKPFIRKFFRFLMKFHFLKRKILIFLISLVLLSSLIFSNSNVQNKTEETKLEPYNLYKHVLKKQNISRSSITCNKSNSQHLKPNFPKSFSEKYVLFYNFYLFQNLMAENEVNIFNLNFNDLITSKDLPEMIQFLSKLKFCTIKKLDRNFDSVTLFGGSSKRNEQVSLMNNNFSKYLKNGGYYHPPMCFQEYLYYHSSDGHLYYLKKMLDSFRVNPNQNMISLIKKLSDLTYKIVKEHYNSESKRLEIFEFIRTKENDLTMVVIPFLRREKNLLDLMANLHPFLQRQFLHYKILVVEQSNFDESFNKGRLYNSAFDHFLRNYKVNGLNDELTSKNLTRNLLNVECMIFHDVDLIPESDYNIYGCGEKYSTDTNRDMPRHLSLSIHKISENLNVTRRKVYYKPNLYELLVGGVLCLKPKIYQAINGFSNEYWNWGAEDDGILR